MLTSFLRAPARLTVAWFLLMLPTVRGNTPLAEVQAAASTWAQLRSETSRLETEWSAERGVLAASVSGLQLRADQITAERDTLMAETARTRRELEELAAANVAAAARITDATTQLAALAARLADLRPALPPRLSTALDLAFRSAASEGLPPAERLQHVMTILNRCNQFNQTFVLAEEILTPEPGGEPRLLEVIYWGLAQACALDRSGGNAYVGRPVDGRWTWQKQSDLVDAVSEVLAIHRDQAEPRFVTLPAQITGGAR